MKEKLRQVVNNTDNETKDIPFVRYYIFVEKSSCEYSILNCSDSYKDICDAYKSCESVYPDFVPFIYDYDKDQLLDYGEEPDKEIDNLDCEVEIEEEDVVNKPKHYNREGAMECFDEFVELYGVEAGKVACLFNIHKYRYRAADKNGLEGLKKSDWYMAKHKELNKK